MNDFSVGCIIKRVELRVKLAQEGCTLSMDVLSHSHMHTFTHIKGRELQLLDLQLFPGSSNWHLTNIRYYVHSDYGIESYMLFEADSTSASSLETDSGTSDKHLTRNGLGELP